MGEIDSVSEENHHHKNNREIEVIDYQDTQQKIVLSDTEKKNMWDEYKYYVDESVFIELECATFCR